MKMPANIDAVTLSSLSFDSVYPPSGFYQFEECALGNGDHFGLYWPVGREMDDPLVVEMWHDNWEISPCYSNLSAFLAHCPPAEDGDEGNRPFDATLATDSSSPLALLNAGKEEIRRGNVDTAILLLEKATGILPEYGAALTALSSQYRRKEQRDAAMLTALAAIIAFPSFGGMQAQTMQWFQHQSECPKEMRNDPLWINRKKLTGKFGGQKENETYRILQEAINQYASARIGWKAIVLHMTYGELMIRETTSFQERYGFEPHLHHEALSRLIAELGYQQRTLPPSKCR